MPPLSPSRLNNFLGCEHRTYLDILAARGALAVRQAPRPDAQLILERGRRHEQAFLDGLRARGRDVLSFEGSPGTTTERAAATGHAMAARRDVIHQACFVHGDWVGYADFLVRVDEPSDLGPWSYEVHDAKLARHAKPDYVFQLLFYTDQVERIQGLRPRRMHLILGDGEQPPFAPEDFEAYAAQVVARFLERREQLAGPDPEPTYPYPVAECDYCPFWKHCDERRRSDDHLSLVASLQRRQGLRLEAEGVHTVEAIAALPADVRVPRLSAETLAALRHQARLQVESRGATRPVHELLEPEAGRGFARLPRPSEGDVYFDFEGDPLWGDHGLQYLFGTGYYEGGEWRYWPLWAEDERTERTNFEKWMRWITERLEAFPDLHVYHYNHYEPTTLKALMSRYGVGEDEVDELLRRTVMVDLFAVVRQSMRVGVERYGLKWLEPVFGFERTGEIEGGSGSLRHWQTYLDTGNRAQLEAIRVYNDNDCRSTAALLRWLHEQRRLAEEQYGVRIDELGLKPPRTPGDKLRAWLERLDAARTGLDAVPGAELLAQLIDYHRREAKPAWWAYFARLEMTPDELRDEDPEAIGGLVEAPDLEPEPIRRSWRIPLRFPQQRYKLDAGDAVDTVTGKTVKVHRVDEADRVVWIERGQSSKAPLPTALAPGEPYKTFDQQEALVSLAERTAEAGIAAGVADDLLLRRGPRLSDGAPSLGEGRVDLDLLREQVASLDASVLFIQGPPGSGKTYTGARLAVDLMRRGMRVGVMATSHKAIANLLEEIDECADEERFGFRGLKKCSDGDDDSVYESARIESVPDRRCFTREAAGDVQLLAGTAWLWSWADMLDAVDVLFVDEAGQVALADALAVSHSTTSMVLLGDPQQLAHVSQGTHPDGSGESVLRHLLQDRNTVMPGAGVLLNRSWRMHPDICRFVSETMYDSKLEWHPDCVQQRVDSPGLSGSGLRWLPVEHEERDVRSPEEADVVAAEVARLLDGGSYVDRDGVRHDLTLDDILVVAPFNAQVRCLRSKLPAHARVGTVDKFQGQEAPVVFFSMATSSGEDAPRGMDFLFSRNRLNVAVSRAQSLAVVVCSPRLLWTPTSTVEQMRLVNMLCRAVDHAVKAGDVEAI